MRIAVRGPLSIPGGALAIVACLGGCATGPDAKAVFLQQHRALAALTEAITVAELEQPELADRLYGTEEALSAACAPLQTAGHKKMADEAISPALGLVVVRTLSDCAQMTQEVERLLWQVDPETAGYFLTQPTVVSVVVPE